MDATATTRVEEVVSEALVEIGVKPEAIRPEATFESLNLDSLDVVEVMQVVEEELGVEIRGDEVKNLVTVGAAVDLIATRIT